MTDHEDIFAICGLKHLTSHDGSDSCDSIVTIAYCDDFDDAYVPLYYDGTTTTAYFHSMLKSLICCPTAFNLNQDANVSHLTSRDGLFSFIDIHCCHSEVI